MVYEQVFPGIDWVFYDKGEGLTGYDYILDAGANPADLKIELTGEKPAYLDRNGNLLQPTATGLVRHSAPYTYQVMDGKKVEVKSRFELSNGPDEAASINGGRFLSVALEEYNEKYPVVIDPAISYEDPALLEEALFSDYILNSNQNVTVTCGSTHRIFDSGGSAGNYNGADNYTITLCSDNGQPIVVQPVAYLLQPAAQIFIYDGNSTAAPQFSGSPFIATTGSLGTFPVLVASGTCVTIRFVAGGPPPFGPGSFQGGFEIDLWCIGTANNITACTGPFTDPAGSGSYGAFIGDQTVICSDNGGQAQVTFTSFDLGARDQLRIYNGSTINAANQIAGSPFTGTGSPGTVTAAGTCLTFVFIGDALPTSPGWNAAISCVGGGGGGTADYTIDGSDQNTCMGEFADSGDSDTNYGNNENHTATFCSDNNQQIVFTFSEFNTQESVDLLYVYDGPDDTYPQVAGSPFSGSGPLRSPGAISSTGTCLTFRFVSDGSVTSLGWIADITCSGSAGAGAGPIWGGYPGGTACGTNTQLGGTVFDDFNNDGIRGSSEAGIRDVSVNLFDDNGQVGSSTTTNASGSFTFSGLSAGQVYRVEFLVPDIWQEGALGSGSGTSVQFVQAGQCNANLGLLDKARYCTESNPNYLVPCYINGDPSHSSNNASTSVARFLYNDSGNSPAASYSNYITMGNIGTVWGMAYNADDQQVYASAFLKRHAGLGTGGIGAIYRRPVSGGNTSSVMFYDFGAAAGTVATNATRFPGTGNAFGQLGACGLCDNIDPTAFAQIGKVGLGSMEMSPDDKTLYVTNLYDRKVYRIDASTNSPAPGSATALSGAPWLSNPCSNGVARPFALKYYRGKLHVGVICDGSAGSCNPTSACNDLTATVYAYDGSNWTTLLSYPVNYYRKAYATGSNYWVRWIDDWNVMAPYVSNKTDAQFAQPIFAAIEFDDDGSLIMSFADRSSYQMGYLAPPPVGPSSSTAERNFAHGDILRAYYNPNTQTFTMENNGVAGPLTSTNPSSTSGIGGKSFYWGDYWYGAYNNSGVGSMSLVPGKGEVLFSLADPIDPYANGIAFISNTNGKSNRRIEVYQGSPSGNAPNFAKSGGLGQIVIQCAAPDIEIGNYVWWDTDLDGLMDPGEPGIPNVSLRLYLDPDGNTQGNNPFNNDEVHVATTTTDNYGRYIFSKSGASNGLNPQTWQSGHTRVLTEQTYQVRILNWATDPGLVAFATGAGSPVFQLSSTQNQGTNGGLRDNNAYDNPGNAGAAVLTGLSGENDHGFDFAFGAATCTSVTVMPTGTTPCVGGDLELMANPSGGVPPYTYSWTGPNGFSSSDENPVLSSVSLAAAGNYNLTVIDDTGCDATFVLPVVVNELAITATPTNPSCGATNGSIDVEITTGGLAPFSYDWSDNSLDGTEDAAGLAAGSYAVTVTDANGCTDVATLNLSGSGGPTVIISGVDPTCSLSNGSISLTVSGGAVGYTFDWNNNSLDGTEDPTGLAAGTYTVTVTDGASCAATANITLVTTIPPSLSETHVNAACGASNGAIDITVTDGTAPFTFDWADLAGTDNGEDRTGLAAGNYSVVVTDGNGCTDNISVVITGATGPTLTVDPTDETCSSSNGNIDLTINGGTGPFSIDWSYNGTGQVNDPEDPAGLAAGTYNVTVTDANTCTATLGVTIMNSPGITELILNPVDATACVFTNGSIGLTVAGGTPPYAYDWDNDGESPPDYDAEDLANVGPGTFTVTVTDANGCLLTGSATVGVSTGATLATIVTDPTTCAETGSVDLTITGGVGPMTVEWSNGATTEDLTALAPGVYTVTVTEANGCEVTENISIRDIREPVLSVVLTSPGCGAGNGAIDLTISDPDGTGPYAILWDDPSNATTEDISGLQAGIYTVTVTNGISCMSVLTVNLNATMAPELTVVQTNESCSAGNGAIDLTISGGTPNYTIDWDVLPDQEDHANITAGTYNVTVTDDVGCVATATVVITNNPPPTLTSVATAEACTDADGTIEVTVDGVGPFTYQWDNDGVLDNDDVEDLAGLEAGDYNLTVTDANGCTNTLMVTVPNICPPCDIVITATDLSSCVANMFDATLSLDWENAPTTGNFEYSIDGGPFLPLTRTNFSANATDELVVIPGLTCNQVRMIELRFEGTTACYEQVVFVFPPADPAGYIYCVETGQVITGGTVSVTPPAGGSINIVDDGSTGRYLWVATGSPVVAGVYQMTYTPPAGYTVTGTPGVWAGDTDDILDPTAGSEDNAANADPLLLGSDVNGGGTALLDFSTAANPFFLAFDLEQDDAFVDLNNLPLTGCCDIVSAGLVNIVCNDNGTPSNGADDFLTFSLNPTGSSTSSGYAVTASSGSINPTVASYGSPSIFQLQAGSAGAGDVTITITDILDPACNIQIVVTDPGACICPPGKCLPAKVTINRN